MLDCENCSLDEARQPVIIAVKRTAIGRAFGAFEHIKVENLLVPLFHEIVTETAIDPSDIDDVIIGNAAGGGGNIARLAALSADLGMAVPGLTIDRQCGSGLEAINLACRLVASGAGNLYLAGGAESVSTAPLRARRSKGPDTSPMFYDRAQFSPHSIGDPDMGIAAENVAQQFGVSRSRQDEFAYQSHQRACLASEEGRFETEIVPIQVGEKNVDEDECIRCDTSTEVLSKLPARFADNGTVTAGNSCPINDGAAIVLVTNLSVAKKLGVEKALAFIDGVTRGVDPNILGIGPVASTQYLLKRDLDITIDDLKYIEFNEAFASQVLASLDQLDIDPRRVNLDGGALALGHPFGASGAILVTRLYSQMLRNNDVDIGAMALATLGTAGGMGVSTFFQSIRVK